MSDEAAKQGCIQLADSYQESITDTYDHEAAVESGDLANLVPKMLSLLPQRERLVLAMRFGLDGHAEHSLGEVGEALGISKERVRQIEESGKKRIYKRIRKNPLQ